MRGELRVRGRDAIDDISTSILLCPVRGDVPNGGVYERCGVRATAAGLPSERVASSLKTCRCIKFPVWLFSQRASFRSLLHGGKYTVTPDSYTRTSEWLKIESINGDGEYNMNNVRTSP